LCREIQSGSDERDGLRIDQNPPLKGLRQDLPDKPDKVPFDLAFGALLMALKIPIEENPGVLCQRTASLTIHYSHIMVEYLSSVGRREQKM
jgi:hypothetical protein